MPIFDMNPKGYIAEERFKRKYLNQPIIDIKRQQENELLNMINSNIIFGIDLASTTNSDETYTTTTTTTIPYSNQTVSSGQEQYVDNISELISILKRVESRIKYPFVYFIKYEFHTNFISSKNDYNTFTIIFAFKEGVMYSSFTFSLGKGFNVLDALVEQIEKILFEELHDDFKIYEELD